MTNSEVFPKGITAEEAKLLRAIRDSEFHDAMPVEKRAGNPVWVDCIWGFEGKAKFGGVMASLRKKGLAGTDGECCWLTQAGLDASSPNDQRAQSTNSNKTWMVSDSAGQRDW